MTKLTIELVPSTCWYTNVRSNVTKAEWDRIRNMAYKAAGNCCEVCGGRGYKWPVEAHEIWDYDDQERLQTLKRIIALCPDCHLVKHIGRAEATGQLSKALKHLMRINSWSKSDAEEYVAAQFELWAKRSKYQWRLDLSLIEQYKEVK
jgi:hypothetical protein